MNKVPMSEAWPLLPLDEYDEKGVFSFLTCQLRLVSGVCWDQGRQRSGRDRWSFSHYFLLLSSVISVKKSKQTSACCAECQQKSCCIFLFWSISVRWWTCTYPLGTSHWTGPKCWGSGTAALLLTTLKPKLVTTAPPPSWISGAGVMLWKGGGSGSQSQPVSPHRPWLLH